MACSRNAFVNYFVIGKHTDFMIYFASQELFSSQCAAQEKLVVQMKTILFALPFSTENLLGIKHVISTALWGHPRRRGCYWYIISSVLRMFVP